MEFKRPTGDFNLNALPSEEKWRKLMYLATSGNDVVHTSLTTTANGGTIQEKQKREDRAFYDAMGYAIASRERVEVFTQKLDRYDEAATAALLENEQKLRIAREELRRVRERAFEATSPDGKITKIYRDGAGVRDDKGAEVNWFKADDIPENSPAWAERFAPERTAIDLMRRNDTIRAYQEKISEYRKLSGGQPTEEALRSAEEELEKMPDDVRGHLKDPNEGSPANRAQSSPTFETSVRPTARFTSAAHGAPAYEPSDTSLLPAPGVSAPAPR